MSQAADRQRFGPEAARVSRLAGIVGVVGLLAGVIIAVMMGEHGWERFFRSYLTAFVFVLAIALGALFFTIVQHITRAGWSVTVRRFWEAIASNLVWMWVLFLPILILAFLGKGDMLFHWMSADVVAQDELLQHKTPFLNIPFWGLRAVIYFGIWALLGWTYYRTSVTQDTTGDVGLTHRLQAIAPISIVLFALTLTFAAFDWIMSLEAHWFSTMFGVYFFACSCCASLAATIILIYFTQQSGRVQDEISLEHYQDLGKLLFGFGVVFWCYIGFSQFMLIWYANIPEETTWFIARTQGNWLAVSWFLLIGHFVIPFLLLVTKHTKRVRWVLALIAGWLLMMHYVDMYWLVMPHVPAMELSEVTTMPQLVALLEANENHLGFHPGLTDLACLAGIGGLFVAGTVRALTSCSLVPVRDPRLAEALAFENM